MRNIINVVLALLTVFFAYWLYNTIREPIRFAAEKSKRGDAVISKLKDIQSAEDVYRMVTGKFAGNFDQLRDTINNGNIALIKLTADPNDPTNQDKFVKSVTYKSAKDSLRAILMHDVNLDSLKYIPYSDGKTFDIAADTLTYQNTLVQVVQVGTKWKDFMGEYADPKFKKYDNFYDPEKALKFGDMNSPNTNGNW
ncbi:MAG: hypothetical protein H6567_05690 [Lewinellaceae bacterium]|nr:hypothetical protein [Lewinellaceae bacterium]